MGTIVITGASSGIGAAAAVELARRGHAVVASGRSPKKLAKVRDRMARVAPQAVEVPDPVVADLASLTGVRVFAEIVLDRCPRIDVLVNNAGVQPTRRQLSSDGFELNFAVNHLAHFLLTDLLLERLKDSGGRVVTTASDTHERAQLDLTDLKMDRQWETQLAYGNSKLANILFTAELRRRTSLAATCFHPGAVRTDINREAPFVRLLKPFERFFLGTPEAGADTLVWLATDPEGCDPSALYYENRRPIAPSPAALDVTLAGRLWEVSATLVQTPVDGRS